MRKKQTVGLGSTLAQQLGLGASGTGASGSWHENPVQNAGIINISHKTDLSVFFLVTLN